MEQKSIKIEAFESDNNYVNAIVHALKQSGKAMTSTELIKFCAANGLADQHHLYGEWDSPICRTLTSMVRPNERNYCRYLRRDKRVGGKFDGRYEYWWEDLKNGETVKVGKRTLRKLSADDEIVEINGKRYIKSKLQGVA